MAAEIDLIVRLKEIPQAENELGFGVALESGAGSDIEDAIGAIAIISRVAAALDFEVIDIFGVDLRAEMAGDVGIGNGDAVDEPTDLVTAADVELIVSDVRAGDIVRDHGEAVGP